MEKEENPNLNNKKTEQGSQDDSSLAEENVESENKEIKTEQTKEITPEEKVLDLEDKLTRTFAEMENQRRRFEKEKEDAFEYGGYSFAKAKPPYS